MDRRTFLARTGLAAAGALVLSEVILADPYGARSRGRSGKGGAAERHGDVRVEVTDRFGRTYSARPEMLRPL